MGSIKESAKAYLAAVGALASYLVGVLDPTALGFDAFAAVTTTQWIGAIIAVLGVFGVTWSVPNRTVTTVKTVEPERGAVSVSTILAIIALVCGVLAVVGFGSLPWLAIGVICLAVALLV